MPPIIAAESAVKELKNQWIFDRVVAKVKVSIFWFTVYITRLLWRWLDSILKGRRLAGSRPGRLL